MPQYSYLPSFDAAVYHRRPFSGVVGLPRTISLAFSSRSIVNPYFVFSIHQPCLPVIEHRMHQEVSLLVNSL